MPVGGYFFRAADTNGRPSIVQQPLTPAADRLRVNPVQRLPQVRISVALQLRLVQLASARIESMLTNPSSGILAQN
jgi:hypothetical protein